MKVNIQDFLQVNERQKYERNGTSSDDESSEDDKHQRKDGAKEKERRYKRNETGSAIANIHSPDTTREG